MAINKAVAGQAILKDVHYYVQDDTVRAVGTGTNADGDQFRVDRKKSLGDLGATAEQVAHIEKAASIIAGLLGGFEGGDVSKVETELQAERELKVVEEAPIVETLP